MVGLAGIAKTLGEIVWANAEEVDARHRENGVEVVEHGTIFQQRAYQHLLVCLAVVRRLIGNPGIVVGAPVGPERPLAERTEISRPHELAGVRLGGDVRAHYAHDPAIEIAQDG